MVQSHGENRPDKQGRKDALAAWKAGRQAVARAALPLPNELMQALFDMLDVELLRCGCDHTLRLIRRWLASEGLPVEPMVEWLKDNGGYCDCEALANAEQAWQAATGRG